MATNTEKMEIVKIEVEDIAELLSNTTTNQDLNFLFTDKLSENIEAKFSLNKREATSVIRLLNDFGYILILYNTIGEYIGRDPPLYVLTEKGINLMEKYSKNG